MQPQTSLKQASLKNISNDVKSEDFSNAECVSYRCPYPRNNIQEKYPFSRAPFFFQKELNFKLVQIALNVAQKTSKKNQLLNFFRAF
jgi:hypothetical protein